MSNLDEWLNGLHTHRFAFRDILPVEDKMIVRKIIDNRGYTSPNHRDNQVLNANPGEQGEEGLVEWEGDRARRVELEPLRSEMAIAFLPVQKAIQEKVGFNTGNGLNEIGKMFFYMQKMDQDEQQDDAPDHDTPPDDAKAQDTTRREKAQALNSPLAFRR